MDGEVGNVKMRLHELDKYFRGLMAIDELSGVDNSLNGIQVGRPDMEIRKAAFAVDACMETFERATASGANLVFVHHGMFWGHDKRVTGSHYRRIAHLIENECALYAVHLPLDSHPEFGNNAGMASAIGLTGIEPFGEYHGVKIGVKGSLASPLTIDGILEKLQLDRGACRAVLPFGKKDNTSIGIVSGGATREIEQAIDEGLDLYLTGESTHMLYHLCLEEEINLVSGGHYQTEEWGVSLLRERFERETGLPATYIDVPTGL